MHAAYEGFRDTVQWARKLGDAPYRGIPNRAAAEPVAARKQERIQELGGDAVSNVQFQLMPENEPHVGDAIDDAEILDVASVKDSAGNVLWWVAYGRQ